MMVVVGCIEEPGLEAAEGTNPASAKDHLFLLVGRRASLGDKVPNFFVGASQRL